MKAFLKYLSILTLLAFAFAPLARAQDQPDDQGVSFQTFYDQLGDQGTWVQTDDYGYVFQPNVQDPNWAPYTDGNWAYTDAGWTWVSNEPWGWATYHYGRWANIDGTGWVWVPGYQWAPAWVSWRYGGGYAGWAPLPPESFVGAEYGDGGVAVGVGFHFGNDVDVNFNIGPGCYNFVRVGDLCQPNYRGRYVNRNNNYVIINNTTNITNVNINRNGRDRFRQVAVGGPSLNEVNAHSSRRFEKVNLTESNQPGRSTLQGNSLAVYAPRVNPATAHDARPSRVGQTIDHPSFNRGDSISKPMDVTSTVKPTAPDARAIQAAQAAQLHAPAKAKIASDRTPARTTFNKPLTSLQPVAPRTTSPQGQANTVHPNNVEHPAVNAPSTGEQAQTHVAQPEANPAFTGEPKQQHIAQPEQHVAQPEANPAFTGEPKQHHVAQPEANPAFTGEPAKQHHVTQPEANPAFTGESVKPTTEHHVTQPATTYHPAAEAPATAVHHEPTVPHTESFHPNNSGGGAVHPEASHVAPAPHPAGAPHPAVVPHPAPANGQPNAKEQKKQD